MPAYLFMVIIVLGAYCHVPSEQGSGTVFTAREGLGPVYFNGQKRVCMEEENL